MNVTLPLLSLGVIFPKDDGQKCLKRTKKKNTRISTQQTFFCIIVSTCQRQDRFNKLLCTFKTKRDDKDDKLTKRQKNNGRTQIKLH